MKALLLPLFFTIVSGAALSGLTPQSLELDSNGKVDVLLTDSSSVMTIRPILVETSSGTWNVPRGSKIAPDSGTEVKCPISYKFPDDSEVEFVLQANIKGTDLVVSSSWPTASEARGFGMLTLLIPKDLKADLVGELNGAQIFPPKVEGSAIKFKSGGELVFKSASTGKFLFKITGDFVSGDLVRADGTEDAISLRFFNLAHFNEATIGEATELGFTVSFKE